jgi:rubredoxin
MAEVEDSAECPSCGDRAQPEQDDDLIYWACGCGFEFGYRRVVQEDTCAAGVRFADLPVRYDAAQPPGAVSLESGGQRQSVFLGTTIKRRPDPDAIPYRLEWDVPS